MVETLPLQIPMVPGGMEMVVILLIAVLLFGANKIPKLARSTGQAMGEFQKGRQEVEEELQEMQEPLETEGEQPSTESTTSTSTSSSSTSSKEAETSTSTE